MMKLLAILIFLLNVLRVEAQADSTVFERIKGEVSAYKPDFSPPPDDRLTSAIKELRQLGGGFNINEAIAFKLAEDRKEGKISQDDFDRLGDYLIRGEGAEKINNAVNRIYRDQFSLKEIKQLIKFYRTPAGKKMNRQFPVMMLKSLMIAENLTKNYQTNK